MQRTTEANKAKEMYH